MAADFRQSHSSAPASPATAYHFAQPVGNTSLDTVTNLRAIGMQAPSRRQAVVLFAAQKAEYIWADGNEGSDDKVWTPICEIICRLTASCLKASGCFVVRTEHM